MINKIISTKLLTGDIDELELIERSNQRDQIF